MAFDILALGTSNTNCKGVERSKIFPAHLEELLRADRIDARVINAGVDGDKPFWMENRLRDGITEKTHIVIFEPGPNDKNKSSNVEYAERILSTLHTMQMATIYVSNGWIQTNDEAEETARKFGAYYYGHFNKDVPTEKWLRLFEQNSPIYKWNPSGLVWAKRSQC